MKLEHWMHFYRARVFLLLKQEEKAIDALNAAIAANADFALAASCLGHHYASKGQMHLAEKNFLEALRIDPNDAVTHFNLGFNYERQKQYGKAIDAFQSAVKSNPKSDRAWYGMGLAHAALNQHDAAAKAFEQAAELQPMNPHAWYSLGMAHYTMGNKDKLRDVIAHLNRFDPKMTKQLIRETSSEAQ